METKVDISIRINIHDNFCSSAVDYRAFHLVRRHPQRTRGRVAGRIKEGGRKRIAKSILSEMVNPFTNLEDEIEGEEMKPDTRPLWLEEGK